MENTYNWREKQIFFFPDRETKLVWKMSASFDNDKRISFALQLISKLLITILRSEIDADTLALSYDFFQLRNMSMSQLILRVPL